MSEKIDIFNIKPQEIEVKVNNQAAKIKVSFNPRALDYGKKLELKDKASLFSYAELDYEKYSKLKEGDGLPIKSANFREYMKAKLQVDAEYTRIVWGLTNYKSEQISAYDFDKLIKIAVEADLLDVKKDEEEARKKKEELKVEKK
jgi:hypothetical protein